MTLLNVFFWSACTLIMSASALYADIYKYVDDSNVVCITNSLDSVPKKFRSSVKVTKEDVLPVQQKLLPEVQLRKTQLSPLNTQFPPKSEPQKETHALPVETREKYLNTGLVLAGLVGGYFLLSRLTGSLGFPKIGMIAFLLLVLTGGVYLYNLYLKEMTTAFSDLRKNALGMKKNVETRENKTEQMLKSQPEAE